MKGIRFSFNPPFYDDGVSMKAYFQESVYCLFDDDLASLWKQQFFLGLV